MARALVIGGTLFIGRALVEQLLARGDDVVIMHRGTGRRSVIASAKSAATATMWLPFAPRCGTERFDVVYDNVYDWQRGTTADQVSAAVTAAASERVASLCLHVEHRGLRRRRRVRRGRPLVAGRLSQSLQRAESGERTRAVRPASRQRGSGDHAAAGVHLRAAQSIRSRSVLLGSHRAGRPIVVPEDGSRTMQWVHVRGRGARGGPCRR